VAAHVFFCPQCGGYLPESVGSCTCGFVIPARTETTGEHDLSEPASTLFPAATPGVAAATPRLPGLPFVEASPPLPAAPIGSKKIALIAATLLVLIVSITAAVYWKNNSFHLDRALTPAPPTDAATPQGVPQNGARAPATDSVPGGNEPITIENRFLVGTYVGTIGTKDFKLFIDKISGEDVEGYDVAGTNRRPVRGRVAGKTIEATGAGGHTTIFKLILNEPGDAAWDGEFNIDLSVSDIGRHGEGTWRSFDRKLERDIRITDLRNVPDARPRETQPGSDVGDYRTGTFLDGFPMIDARVLRPNDISGLSARELGLLRNFIYARHGRPFASPMYRAYFSQFPWYQADPSYTDDLLNRTERENGEIIRRRERAVGAAE
jgi:hypothetical protein